MEGLFKGVKVVDAASFLAGPCAATIMADYGADVIKIEPLSGDGHRGISGGHPSEWSWQLTNRNKRSVSLDINKPEGYQLLIRLIESADVLVVNFSSSQLAKFNLEWDTLKAINPRLVFAQITAFGNKGADANRRAFDLTGWFARTGILNTMRNKGQPPTTPAGGVGDHATAMTLYAGIVSALYQRDRTGEGCMVTTSLAATGTWANGLHLQGTVAGEDAAERRDKEDWSNPLSNVYETKDGRYILLALQNMKRDYPKLVKVLEHEEWLEEPEMRSVRPLFKNRIMARQRIASAFLKFDSSEMLARLDETGIVHELIAKNTEVIEDEQLIENEVIIPYDSGKPHCDRTFATPFRLSTVSQRTPVGAPEIGEHTEQVLDELGLDQDEIRTLREGEVVRS